MRREAIQTPLGVFTAQFSARGLRGLAFPSDSGKQAAVSASAPTGGDASETVSGVVPRHGCRLTRRALAEALAGRPISELPPFDWTGCTPFQQEVWRELLRSRPGQVRTYAQIAAAIGRPQASRAVGGACGANPIPVLVPCHRVVAAGGGLGGFSGGLDWKRRLLALEGVRF
jgi:methylated-DNA-[protein]-cysteine S-methyltransferase